MSFRAILALATALLLGIAPAQARASTYFPQNGAELLAAVDALDDPENWSGTLIVLADTTYLIDRPIVLDGQDTDTIRAAEGAHPIITGTSGTTLLRMRGENYRVDDILFRAPATQSSYPLVELRGRAQFRSTVDVPATAPNVTGILTTPSGLTDDYSWTNTIGDVTSDATNAPAVKVTGTARFDGTIAGGNPTVDIDLAATAGEPTAIWFRGDLIGGPNTHTVLQTRTNKRRLPITTHNSTITALRPGATGIRIRGATHPAGTLDLHLYTSTIDLVDGGTAIAIEPGAETKPTTIDAIGLLALGTGTAIACAPPSTTTTTAATVTIDAIYREAEHAPTGACTINEQRRVTGDPRFTDRENGDLTPRWGSALIDAAPRIMLDSYSELSTYTKPSPAHNSAPLPNDIGAAEYQYTQPEVIETTTATLDNRGLVRLSATAYDPDPTDQDSLQYEWTLEGKTKLTGPTVYYRWESEPDATPWVSLKVTDRTGEFIYDSVLPHPIVNTAASYVAYDPAAYQFPLAGGSTSTPGGEIPPFSQRPRPTPTRTPVPTPRPAAPRPPKAVINAFTLTESRAANRAKRPSGIGPARAGESSASITLSGPAKVNFAVLRANDGKRVTTLGLRLPAGTTPLHFTARVGRLRLPPGRYTITASIGTRSVSAPVHIRIRR